MIIRKTRFIILFFIVIFLAIALIGFPPTPKVIESEPVLNTTATIKHLKVNQVSSLTVLGYQSKYGPLPNSLEGTIMQQALLLDENGNLLVTQDLMRIFNFFLSTSQEENLDTVINRIQEYLAHYLQGEPLSEALVILDQYIDMKKAMLDLEQEQLQLMTALKASGHQTNADYYSQMANLLKARGDIRSQYLSPEVAHAFFGRQDQLDEYTLSRMRVNADTTLTAQQKAAALEEINTLAPADLVASRAETQLPDTLREQTSELIENGASEADIRALRVELVGEEAAQRFEILDQERAQWQTRVDNYLNQRQSILSAQGITESQQSEQINQLRSEQFDSREQIRVKVYERNEES